MGGLKNEETTQRDDATELVAEANKPLVATQWNISERLEEFIRDYVLSLTVERMQEFKGLVDEVRRISRPMSIHPLTYTGDLEVFASMFPATARRIKSELDRLHTIVTRKDGHDQF